MLINKFKYISNKSKKVLHKIKKHWVVISVVLLGLLGGATATSQVHVEADENTYQPTITQQATQLHSNLMNNATNNQGQTMQLGAEVGDDGIIMSDAASDGNTMNNYSDPSDTPEYAIGGVLSNGTTPNTSDNINTSVPNQYAEGSTLEPNNESDIPEYASGGVLSNGTTLNTSDNITLSNPNQYAEGGSSEPNNESDIPEYASGGVLSNGTTASISDNITPPSSNEYFNEGTLNIIGTQSSNPSSVSTSSSDPSDGFGGYYQSDEEPSASTVTWQDEISEENSETASEIASVSASDPYDTYLMNSLQAGANSFDSEVISEFAYNGPVTDPRGKLAYYNSASDQNPNDYLIGDSINYKGTTQSISDETPWESSNMYNIASSASISPYASTKASVIGELQSEGFTEPSVSISDGNLTGNGSLGYSTTETSYIPSDVRSNALNYNQLNPSNSDIPTNSDSIYNPYPEESDISDPYSDTSDPYDSNPNDLEPSDNMPSDTLNVSSNGYLEYPSNEASDAQSDVNIQDQEDLEENPSLRWSGFNYSDPNAWWQQGPSDV